MPAVASTSKIPSIVDRPPGVDTRQIEGALAAAQSAVEAGQGLSGTGFWKAVASVKSHPDLVDRFAPRIAEIDRKAFLQWTLWAVSARVGTAVMGLLTLVGVILVVWSWGLSDPWNGLVLLGASGGLLVTTTHGLGHLMVGAAVGIRFTHWFVGSWSRLQPGVKVDYDTYLRAAPRCRAWMHASGAIVTKLIPFVMLAAVLPAEFPAWTAWLLLAQGVLQVLTDAAWSVKMSDWKKFRREMSYV